MEPSAFGVLQLDMPALAICLPTCSGLQVNQVEPSAIGVLQLRCAGMWYLLRLTGEPSGTKCYWRSAARCAGMWYLLRLTGEPSGTKCYWRSAASMCRHYLSAQGYKRQISTPPPPNPATHYFYPIFKASGAHQSAQQQNGAREGYIYPIFAG